MAMTLSTDQIAQPSGHHILVVDDEPTVRNLLSDYLRGEGFSCEVAGTGQDALEKLGHNVYSVVITDIKMPGFSGLQLLEKLSDNHPEVATIMITAVADGGLETAVQSMKSGACDYITKPFNLQQVSRSLGRALELRHGRIENKETSHRLQNSVQTKTQELNSILRDLDDHREMTLDVLMKALDARGHETQSHSQRVRAYTVLVAREFGFWGERLVNLARGALLHDIGKIGVPDRILLKPGKLTPEEWRIMAKHPNIGYRILKGVKFLEQVAWMVLCHHEQFDGRGYPQGLAGEEVPLEARIFSMMDAYDAMTSSRPYREAMSTELARSRIITAGGTQFDPTIVKAFLNIPQIGLDRIKSKYGE